MAIFIDDNRIKQLAHDYGTPLYIYDKGRMLDNLNALKDALYPGASLYYAMKANPLLGICEVFREQGTGVEVASAGELCVALKAGFDPKHILFTSPGKTEDEIRYAIKSGIKIINIDSIREASIVDKLAKEADSVVDVAIRINPSACRSNAKIKMTGIPSQFGVEEEDLNEQFFESLRSFNSISIKGIQIYMGTQMLDPEDIIWNTTYAMELGIKLSKEYGFKLKYLNCGGGFGVKYFKNEQLMDMQTLKEGMKELHERMKDDLEDTEVIFESGRFLMAPAGVMVTKVLYRKESKGQRFLICDGGSNIHSSSAFLGRFIRNNFPLHAIEEDKSGEETETTICGPLCTSLDVIGQKVSLDDGLKEDDLIVIEQSGAYGYTYSPGKFLSHETPVEVLADQDVSHILRQRGSASDFLNGQQSIK